MCILLEFRMFRLMHLSVLHTKLLRRLNWIQAYSMSS